MEIDMAKAMEKCVLIIRNDNPEIVVYFSTGEKEPFTNQGRAVYTWRDGSSFFRLRPHLHGEWVMWTYRKDKMGEMV